MTPALRLALVVSVALSAACMSADPGDAPGPTPDGGGQIGVDTHVPAVDVPVADNATEPDLFQCPSPVGVKPFFAQCEHDCECQTGLCYDEAFMGDFRFCTRSCEGNCEVGGGDGTQQNQCLIFSGVHKDAYGLTLMNICAPRCNSLDDCKALSSAYDACGTESGWTSWDEKTVGVATCVILDAFK